MASSSEIEKQEALSVVPYDTHRDVVLRHANSVVEFDPRSRQISLRNKTRDVEARSPTRDGTCPTCGRTWPQSEDATAAQADDQPSFINNDYFRLLARSLPGSTDNSRPSSPRLRSIQPVRSTLAAAYLPENPPPEAEFLGSEPAPPSPQHGISETAFAPKYFERFFIIEKELGKGGRGVVLLVKHVLDGVSLGHFACKRVPIGDDHGWLEKVLVEVQALQSLSHQNLVSYRHVWLQDYQLNNFGPSVPCAFILQQYCNGGDLHNYVCGPAQASITTQNLKDRIRRRSRGESELPRKPSEPKRLPFDEIYAFFRDITAGLRFLHLHGFIHRDLKPSNCLLHTTGNETRVLVSDFGEVQYENTKRKSTGATGTISYCAPEVLRRINPGGPFGNFTFKSDIFSLGMILHFLCFADLPYKSSNVIHEEREDVTELRAEIMAWTGFNDQRRSRPDLPAKLYSFLKRLLSINPDDRPTSDEVNNGIRIGGLDQIPVPTRRNSVTPEELSPGRRIQKLDSPAPTNRTANSMASSSLQLRSKLHSSLREPENARATGADTGVQEGEIGRGGESAEIVLHSRPGSALPSPSRPSASPERLTQFLLPPPRQTFAAKLTLQIQILLYTRLTSPSIRITILAMKIISTLQPCMARGSNPALVYPLLALAVFEFTLHPLSMWKAFLTFGVHVAAITYGVRSRSLCAQGNPAWAE